MTYFCCFYHVVRSCSFVCFSYHCLWTVCVRVGVKEGASHHPEWDGGGRLLAALKQREKKTLMLIVPHCQKHLLYCTVQFQTKAHLFVEITVREREREKSGKANEQKEKGTKHRGNHCLLQTLTQSCIRTSLPASIILSNGPFFTWTHCSVSVC